MYCDYLEFRVDGVYRGSLTGDQNWQQETYTLTGAGSHRLQWRYYKDSSDSEGDDRGYVKAVTFTPPAQPAPDTLAQGVDSTLAFTTGGDGNWCQSWPAYYDGDCACSGGISDDNESWMQTTVQGAGTLTFWWKVSSESGCDHLEFYLDNQLQSGRISGEVAWTQKSCTITGAGAHTLKWRYVKDGSSRFGDDCGWVDWVQWSVPQPEPAADAWGTLNYLYDASGRRAEKRMDGRTITKYVYDGDSCIAEYDASGNLRRKYIYGPGIDQPICMIESTLTYAGTYYYHFDALGSVVALTDSDANTVEVYEYDVYGRVGALDPSHPNRFMFTGREYDKETGLYYYRARYYNPQIGRFLQTDPIGYGDGMNWHAYCGNNPANRVDPSGLGLLHQATGRVMVIFGRWTPADVPPGDVTALLVDVFALGQDLIGAGIAGEILGVLGHWNSCLSTNWTWHVYIEILDWNDRNGDLKIDEKDLDKGESIDSLKSEPYWVEVTGVMAIPDQSSRLYVVDGAPGGYSSPMVAYRAGITAAVLFKNPSPGKIPGVFLDPLMRDSGDGIDWDHHYILAGAWEGKGVNYDRKTILKKTMEAYKKKMSRIIFPFLIMI
jgi:RHS repeat-associated protein